MPSIFPPPRFAAQRLLPILLLGLVLPATVAQELHVTAPGIHTLVLRPNMQVWFTENQGCPGGELAPPCEIRASGARADAIGSGWAYTSDSEPLSIYSRNIGVNRLADYAWLGRDALLAGWDATVLATRPASGSLDDEVVADDDYFYWTDNDQIYRTPVHGGPTIPVVNAPGPVEQLAADGQGGVLYVAAFGILYHTVPGATPGTFATAVGPGNVIGFALDDTHVYAVGLTGGVAQNFTLYRAPLANVSNYTAGIQIGSVSDGDEDLTAMTADDGYLYWYKAGFSPDARVVNRLAKSAWNGSPASIDALTPIVDTVFDLASTGQLLFYRASNQVMRIDLDTATPIFATLGIDEVVVNQGVSGIDDFILIRDKPGIVWVEPRIDGLGGVSQVTARVDLRRLDGFGTQVPGTITLTQTRTLTGAPVDRDDPSTVFNFELPRTWTVGGGTIEATIRPVGVSGATATDSAILPAEGFRPKTHVCVKFLPLALTANPTYWVRNLATGSYTPGFPGILRRFETVYPVPELRFYTQSVPLRKPQFLGRPRAFNMAANANGASADSGHLMAALFEHNVWDQAPDFCGGQNARTHYVAMVPQEINTTNPITGRTTMARGSFGEPFVWLKMRPGGTGFNSAVAGLTMAHEFGHNTNNLRGDIDAWQHVGCGIPAGADVNDFYPYDYCSIGLEPEGPGDNNGTGTEVLFEAWGADRVSGQRVGVAEASDFLSSTASRWASYYRWELLVDTIGDRSVASRAPTSAVSDVIVIGGVVDAAETSAEIIRLDHFPPGFEVPSLGTEIAAHCTPASAYQLVYSDADGAEIRRDTVQPTCSEDDEAGAGYYFFHTFASAPGVREIRLRQDDAVDLWDFQVSDEAPTVTIATPTPGLLVGSNFTIAWDAEDPDSEALSYTVQYRIDGADTPWMLLASGLEDPFLDIVDDYYLPGSSAGEFRVIASDGFNIGTAIVEPVGVENKPPAPAILYPVGGAIYSITDSVAFDGRSFDPEQGELPASGMAWSISGPTTVSATGAQFLLDDLPPGMYNAALTATDGSGGSGSTGTVFVVEDKFVPDTVAPSVDGVCDDEAYAADATPIPLRYSPDSVATARFVHEGSRLYGCIDDLVAFASPINSMVTLSFDANDSGDAFPQTGDLAVRLFQSGFAQTQSGGGGAFTTDAFPADIEFFASAGEPGRWAAEVSIDLGRLGGWNHFARLAVSHADFIGGQTVVWPRDADPTDPSSWGRTAFGGNVAQSIAFPSLPTTTLDTGWVAAAASATSGLPVAIASLTPGVCSVDEERYVHLIAFGTCQLEATQPGNAVYSAAAPVLRSFQVVSGNDADGDGAPDETDNCTLVPNPDQIDADGDGYGNACDADFNNDCIVNVIDLGLMRLEFFGQNPVYDLNSDGVVNPVDLGRLRLGFFQPPGPAAAGQTC